MKKILLKILFVYARVQQVVKQNERRTLDLRGTHILVPAPVENNTLLTTPGCNSLPR